MIRFIHTADLHLGTENYGKIDPKTGIHTRLLDFSVALNFCIDTAIAEKVDFFLFCGDAYKTTTPSPTQQKILLNALLRLHSAQIPVIIIVGNHDNPVSYGKVHSLDLFKDLPLSGFYVIAQPQTIYLETQHGPVNIVGIPWPTRNSLALSNKHIFSTTGQMTAYISQAVGTIIEHEASKLDPAIPAVLAGHLTVSTGLFSGSEKHAIYGNDPLFLPSQLAREPFDYVALGHLHRHQDLNDKQQPPIVYAGSIERIDFGEKEEKGFCLVTIHGKGNTDYRFIKGPMRPFIQIEAHLNDASDQTEQLIKKIQQHAIDDAIVKIMYYPPDNTKDTVNIRTVQTACNNCAHLVGIIPIRSHVRREKRVALKVDMDLATLLDTYFESKPLLQPKKQKLVEQALLLYEESKTKDREVNE
jgi:exonuclease SbcD